MNKTVPWSIKGVASDTREAAKEAARRSGLPLGEWLDGIIAERAAKLGVETTEVDNGERLDAVAAELSRLADRSTSEEPEEVHPLGPEPQADTNTSSTTSSEEGVRASSQGERSGEQDPPAVQAFDPPAASAEQVTFSSRDPVPNSFHSGQGRTLMDSRIRGAVHGALAQRVDFEEEELRPTQKALKALSERLESFERENWAGAARDATASPLRSVGDASPNRGRRSSSVLSAVKESSIRYAVAEIARRQAALYAEDPRPAIEVASRPNPVSDLAGGSLDLPSDQGTGEAGRGSLADAVSSLEARLASARPGSKGWAESGTSIEPHQGKTGGDLDPSSTYAKAVAGVSLASSSSPVGVATSETSEDPSEAFATLGRDLRQAIEGRSGAPAALDPARREALHAERGIEDPTHQARLQSPIRRRLMRDASPTTLASVAMQPDRARTDVSGTKGDGGNELLELQATLGEVRALLDQFEPGSAVSHLDRRMDDLAAKIDRGLPQQVGIQVGEPNSVDALVRGIAARIEEAREASADMQRLEALIKQLAVKIDDNNAQPDASAISALEEQMSRLGSRLERSEVSLSALDGVEHSLGELFTLLEQTRRAAVEAAQNTARAASRDPLGAARPSQADPTGTAEGEMAVAGHVASEIAELRAIHDTSSRRTQASLMGLHQTMEKLVEHLANLDIAGRGGNVASQGAESSGSTSAAAAGDLRRAAAAPLVRPEPGLQLGPSSGEGDANTEEVVDPIDTLIEPGLGRAPVRDRSLKAQGGLAPGEFEGPASFIAAARRAARAAQDSASAAQRPSGRVRISGDLSGASASSALERARNFLIEKRRPLLLSLAGLVLLLGALEVAKLGISATDPEHTGAIEAIETAPVKAASTTGGADTADVKPAAASTAAAKPTAADADASVTPSNETSSQSSPKGGVEANLAPAPGAVRSGAVSGNMNPFLPGNSFNLGALSGSLRTLALAGDPAAQYEVGLRFAEGRTVNRDVKAAATWFEKAALQGLAPAQYRLGSAYEKGIGQSRDPATALTWYGRAAEAGNMRAMHNLAVMAAEGAVGKPDYAKAATWFEKAAALGVRDSQYNLAILYARGLGLEQSLIKSYTWFAVAASQGDAEAGKKRDEVGARLDAKSLATAKAAADSFRPGTTVSAANEVSPPPGGWDAAGSSKIAPSTVKSTSPQFTVM